MISINGIAEPGDTPGKGQRNKANALDKANPSKPVRVRHGAYSAIQGYYNGTLDARTREAKASKKLEGALAKHCGYDSLDACPITLQLKIQLAVGSRLFLSLFSPHPSSKTGRREAQGAENTLNRILSELGLKPLPKTIGLHEYLQTERSAVE